MRLSTHIDQVSRTIKYHDRGLFATEPSTAQSTPKEPEKTEAEIAAMPAAKRPGQDILKTVEVEVVLGADLGAGDPSKTDVLVPSIQLISETPVVSRRESES